MPIFRTILFYFGQFFICTLITPIMLFPSLILPYRYFMLFMNVWCYLIITWMEISIGIRHQIIGKENLKYLKAKPYIIVANHQSAYETFFLPRLIPIHAYILKKELLNIPFFGWGLRKAQHIAINRKDGPRSLKKIMQQSKTLFAKRRSIIVFPEGTRTHPDDIKKYHKGAFIIAKELNADIIPISHNAGLAWNRKSLIKDKNIITFTVGQPISTEGKSVNDIKNEAESWIRAHSRKTLD